MHIKLGLKGSTNINQYRERLTYFPDVFEFYLDTNDFTTTGQKHLQQAVDEAKAITPHIVLHQPMRFGEWFVEMVTPETKMPDLYRFLRSSSDTLINFAFKNDVQVLLHGSYSRQTQTFIDMYSSFAAAQDTVFNRLDDYAKQGGDHIMFENSISPLFFYGNPEMDQFIFDKNYRLAFDTSHCFIKSQGDNNVLTASLARLHDHIVHYHLVDSYGMTHDSLPLGVGHIDWASILPLLNNQATSIYEINLADSTRSVEMLQSHRYLTALNSSLK